MRPNSTVKSITLQKTKCDWDIIEKRLKEKGKKKLAHFIRGEIIKLNRSFEECPDCIKEAHGEKIIKRPYIPITIYKDLEKISLLTGIPMSTIIDRFILSPLVFSNDQTTAVSNGS